MAEAGVNRKVTIQLGDTASLRKAIRHKVARNVKRSARLRVMGQVRGTHIGQRTAILGKRIERHTAHTNIELSIGLSERTLQTQACNVHRSDFCPASYLCRVKAHCDTFWNYHIRDVT